MTTEGSVLQSKHSEVVPLERPEASASASAGRTVEGTVVGIAVVAVVVVVASWVERELQEASSMVSLTHAIYSSSLSLQWQVVIEVSKEEGEGKEEKRKGRKGRYRRSISFCYPCAFLLLRSLFLFFSLKKRLGEGVLSRDEQTEDGRQKTKKTTRSGCVFVLAVAGGVTTTNALKEK